MTRSGEHEGVDQGASLDQERDRGRTDCPSAIIADHAWEQVRHVLKLSRREFEVAIDVFDNLQTKDIADHLDISSHTVQTHLQRIFSKLGVRNRCLVTVKLFTTYLSLRDSQGSEITSEVVKMNKRR